MLTYSTQNRVFDEANIALALSCAMKSAHPPLSCRITPVVDLVICLNDVLLFTDMDGSAG